jgi:glyoxylase-like metal-dependent hydrolase (beta-lactamase superfamily II)
MSEPRAIADGVQELIPGLFHYRVHDERIDYPSEAFVVGTATGVVLVDPLPLDDATVARLGAVEAIILSVASHQRSAWRFRRLTGAPVHAPTGAAGLDEAADLWYGDGDRLPGGLRAIHAPGPTEAHHVLYLHQGPGVLLLGDLMVRDPDGTARFLADEHMSDRVRGRQSAWRLLEYRFDLLGFGHGEPIVRGGRQTLEILLKADTGRAG